MADIFTRKISGEELKERFIMVVKSDLEFFPKLGKPFKLKVKDKQFEVFVRTHDVWSVGPKKPLQTYRIDAKMFWDIFPLHFGQKVTISKKGKAAYELS